jgi:hypothetical protein
MNMRLGSTNYNSSNECPTLRTRLKCYIFFEKLRHPHGSAQPYQRNLLAIIAKIPERISFRMVTLFPVSIVRIPPAMVGSREFR